MFVGSDTGPDPVVLIAAREKPEGVGLRNTAAALGSISVYTLQLVASLDQHNQENREK